MKEFIFDQKKFLLRVTITGAIGGVVFAVGLVNILMDPNNYYWLAAVAVGLYTFWESFVSIANPRVVQISDDKITFKAYNKTHSYDINSITSFQVKELQSVKKAFIRINNPGFFKGRYWLNCNFYNDGMELYKIVTDLELKIHPESYKHLTKGEYKEINRKSR